MYTLYINGAEIIRFANFRLSRENKEKNVCECACVSGRERQRKSEKEIYGERRIERERKSEKEIQRERKKKIKRKR